MNPFFQGNFIPWLELGGIHAIAHVRGRGAYGRAWHEAGSGPNKAVISDYPVTDMVRLSHDNGDDWAAEFGDPASETAFRTLMAYSPYHNVQQVGAIRRPCWLRLSRIRSPPMRSSSWPP